MQKYFTKNWVQTVKIHLFLKEIQLVPLRESVGIKNFVQLQQVEYCFRHAYS